MLRIIWIILLAATACQPRRPLTIQDLTFPDVEKAAIAAQKIDTLFLISRNPYAKWVTGYSADMETLFNGRMDTVGVIVYDSLGRQVSNETELFIGNKYHYDSLGIVDRRIFHDWDIEVRYNSRYTFKPDSLILDQQWFTERNRRFFSKFKFDNLGRLIQEVNNDDYNEVTDKVTLRIYKYAKNKLIEQTETVCSYEKSLLDKTINFYYSADHHLDSTITHFSSEYTAYRMVTHYDTLGLRAKSILNDTAIILYQHSVRRQTSL